MLIYSMSVSVDGFIPDREGGFEWTTPSEEQFVSTSTAGR
jgi:dihydrofolate reductase